MAAGSLLGVAINRQRYSFPVGKVETITLYPLDFEEFLWARGKKVVQKGGSAALFGASIEWLNLAGVMLKCQRINQAYEPIAVYADLSAFKLYMGDVGLLTMKSGISQQTILSGEGNSFMGAVTENYVAQQLVDKGYDLYYWESGSKENGK